MADTPRDSCLEFRTLGCGPSLPCAGGVTCHTELCGCKHPKLILADVSEVDRLQRSRKVTEWAEGWQNVKTGRNQDAEQGEAGDRGNRDNLRAQGVWSGLLGAAHVSREYLDTHLWSHMRGHTPLPCERRRSHLGPLCIGSGRAGTWINSLTEQVSREGERILLNRSGYCWAGSRILGSLSDKCLLSHS